MRSDREDRLPHPYRFLNKIVQTTLSLTLERITRHEEDTFLALKRHEKRNFRMPSYPPSSISPLSLPQSHVRAFFPNRRGDRLFLFDSVNRSFSVLRPSTGATLGTFSASASSSALPFDFAVSCTLKEDELLVFGTDPTYYIIVILEMRKGSEDSGSGAGAGGDVFLRGLVYQDSGVPDSVTIVEFVDLKLRQGGKRANAGAGGGEVERGRSGVKSSKGGGKSRNESVSSVGGGGGGGGGDGDAYANIDPNDPRLMISNDGRVVVAAIPSLDQSDRKRGVEEQEEEEEEGEEASPTTQTKNEEGEEEEPRQKMELFILELPTIPIGAYHKAQPRQGILKSTRPPISSPSPSVAESPASAPPPIVFEKPRMLVRSYELPTSRLSMQFVHNPQLLEELRFLNALHRMADVKASKSRYYVKELILRTGCVLRIFDLVRLRLRQQEEKDSPCCDSLFFLSPISCLAASSLYVGIGLHSGTTLLLRCATRVVRCLQAGPTIVKSSPVAAMSFSKRFIAVGSEDGTLRLYDISKNLPIQTICCYGNLGQSISRLRCLDELPLLVCETSEGIVDVIDVPSGEGIGTIPSNGCRCRSLSSGEVIFSMTDETVIVHDLLDRKTPTGLALSYPILQTGFPRRSSLDLFRSFVSQFPHHERNDEGVLDEFLSQPSFMQAHDSPQGSPSGAHRRPSILQQDNEMAMAKASLGGGKTIRFEEAVSKQRPRRKSPRARQWLTFADMKKRQVQSIRHRVNLKSVRVEKAQIEAKERASDRRKRIETYLSQS